MNTPKRNPCIDCETGYAQEVCGRCFDCCWDNTNDDHSTSGLGDMKP